MDVIKDVDGGEWRPVQEEVLQDILAVLEGVQKYDSSEKSIQDR